MSNIIVIDGIAITKDDSGRFSLNDLHRAAGGENRHRPSLWADNQQTQGLVDELGKAGITALVSVKGGAAPGTYAVREMVYAYAMWISAAFHLKVIRAYDGQAAAPRTPGEMLLASAQAIVAVEQRQAEIEASVARIETQVGELAESRVWDHCPQNCEPISKIRIRMNQRYALPDWVVDTIVWRLPLSPKPHGMVRNQREEAKGSQYEVYAVADITRVFADFVRECVQETPTLWSHRYISKRFQLMPEGKTTKPLKAHAQEAATA